MRKMRVLARVRYIVPWMLAVLLAVWIPAEYTRTMALGWSAGVTMLAGGFVVGYLLLSRPSRDPETGHRAWLGEWLWLLVLEAMILLVFLRTTLLYLLIPSRTLTDDLVASYRASSIVFATVFFVELWLLVLWVGRQVKARRECRDQPKYIHTETGPGMSCGCAECSANR